MKRTIDDVKAITDAPNLRGAGYLSCWSCQFSKWVEGTDELTCTKHEFETERDFVCDDYTKVDYQSTPLEVVIVDAQPAEEKSLGSLMALGYDIKSLSREGNTVRIGGYGVRFADRTEKDLTGTYFSARTNYGPQDGAGQQVTINHCVPLRDELKTFADMLLPGATVRRDEIGLFAETVIDLSNEYQAVIADMTEKGMLKWSSGSTKRLIRANDDGEITNWPIAEWALTPIPAEPRLPALRPLKSLLQYQAPKNEPRPEADPTIGKAAPVPPAPVTDRNSNQGAIKMAEELKSVLDALGGITTRLDGLETRLKNEPPAVDGVSAPDKKSIDPVYVLRYGEEDAIKSVVLNDVIGQSHREKLHAMNTAFGKLIRGGHLDSDEMKSLSRQVYPTDYIIGAVKSGWSVSELKTTMVEAQGQLGGYAVPPDVQGAIIKRLPGLTAVRGAGATVIDLMQGTGTDLPEYTGGDDRYVGALRGAWGAETATPGEKNATFGLKHVEANIYTYKVSASQSLVEDAANAIDLITTDISDTFAIDEDEAFLVGDGVGKPLGILPGAANTLSISSVNSGAAATIAATGGSGTKGLKALKRKIPSQYRADAVFVGNSDTFGVVESLVDGQGRFLFDDLSETDRLLNRRVFESEAMPDVAAGAYPLIFGNMRGYAIVQKMGMSIARFQDSNTGINKVEFHVRRRIGGRPTHLFLFATMTVAA